MHVSSSVQAHFLAFVPVFALLEITKLNAELVKKLVRL
jgi:hypothetical protein